MKDTMKPRIEIRLVPLITVNGLSFSTVESTGKKENFDQNMFITLKFIIANVNITTNQNFEQIELCVLQCLNDMSLCKILQKIPKQTKLTKIRKIIDAEMTIVYGFM